MNTKSYLAVVLAVLLIGTAFAPSVVAKPDNSDSVLDTLFGADGEDGLLSKISWSAVKNAGSGFLSRANAKYNPWADEPEGGASTYATNTAEKWNANSASLETWVNKRTDASTSADTAKITFQDKEDTTAVRYVVMDVTSGNEYDNMEMLNASEFESTGRTVDKSFTLSPFASRHASEELDTFITDYASPGNNITKAYLSNMGGKYQGEIEGDTP